VSFAESISTCLRKYAVFRGRASRSEYWWFILFGVLLGFGANIIDLILDPHPITMGGRGYISSITSLAFFLPTLAAAVRRLHDTNRSGYWLLGFYVAMIICGASIFFGIRSGGAISPVIVLAIGLIVFALGILLLVSLIMRGTEGSNRFGADPMRADLDVTATLRTH
jgi:uncharacterized membrane protein YhaH (DUF805 family)